jgi:hypothetical protein
LKFAHNSMRPSKTIEIQCLGMGFVHSRAGFMTQQSHRPFQWFGRFYLQSRDRA